jgi:glycosyltransferase involved in cell wall biosynthesis
MRVMINGIAALERKTGVGYYIDSLYHHLLPFCNENDLLFYPQGVTRKAIQLAREWLFARTKKGATVFAGSSKGNGFRFPNLVSNSREIARNLARRACHKHFQRTIQQSGCTLYHEPNYIPWSCGLPTIVTILDLSVLLHPEWHPIDRVKTYEKHFFRGLSYATHFISISEFTRREMIDNLGISPDRITAIHIGVRPGFEPIPEQEVLPILKELNLPQDYLLYVSTIEPRKNLLTLMRAYCALPDTIRQKHPLVLVGGWGWKAKEIAEYYDSIGKAKGIRHFGYLPDSQLPAVYNGAKALVYPSYYEGFGLPPVEMLACGGAVLASTADSLVEVLQDQAYLIDPNDVDGWREAMSRVLTDPEWANELRVESRAFAQKYTWSECARKTWLVYQQISASKT